jgi:hypothetical protein
MPATAHCLLETIPGLSFLRCCNHSDAAPHQDSDCQSDGCVVVESGAYRIEDNPSFAVPVLAVVPPSFTDLLLPEPQAAPPLPAIVPSPPELSARWQFFFRTALPPRAPSDLA